MTRLSAEFSEEHIAQLGAVLRNSNYSREIRADAFALLAQSTPLRLLGYYAGRLGQFREDTGGCYLPELMVA